MNTLTKQSVMPHENILAVCVCRDPLCAIPFGTCHCGCGGKTRIAKLTSTARYRRAGMPYRYLHGHDRCRSGNEFAVENRDYKSPCWIWKRHINSSGYGMMRDSAGTLRASYAVYYENKFGKVPEGLQLDHKCRQRACVNPDHLDPVTHAINVARGASCTISSEKIRRVKVLLENGTRQIEVAAAVGISQSAVSDIKLGKKDWRLQVPGL